MVNTPAITSLDGYTLNSAVIPGKGGRVVLNSPHPEITVPPIPEIYAGELEWVTRLTRTSDSASLSLKSDDLGGLVEKKSCSKGDAEMTLEMMPEKAKTDGAVCLDG